MSHAAARRVLPRPVFPRIRHCSRLRIDAIERRTSGSGGRLPLVFAGRVIAAAAALALSAALAGCNVGNAASADEAGRVDEARLLAAENDPDNWLAHGRTYAEQRYSPLEQVNDGNVGQLGLAFAVELDTNRGQEATPIVVDGVMYFSTAWSKVMAVDAATGEVLWRYDPQAIGAKGAHACCDVVNRGVAVWGGKVFVGTIDGRLVALDAATGEELWDVVTVDQDEPYTITMAPRVVRGKVIIGNSGAEMGVRGYVSAYDADSGDLVWRFYTVPGIQPTGPMARRPTRPSPGSPAKHGAAPGGKWAAAARCGIRWSTMPSSTSCWSASATAAPGTTAPARPGRATTCSSPRSSRSIPTPAPTSGTTRRTPAKAGTTPPPSRSRWPT
jgi:hypothetical protein